ncbi:MAG: helix-turn-helix transcriptional regulator [Bacteroidota bacterium]
MKTYQISDTGGEGHHFRMSRMERIYERNEGKPDKPHRHDYFTIIWVKSGIGSHQIDFNSYPIENDLVFFLSPRQVHQIVAKQKPIGCVINFTHEFIARNNIDKRFIHNINLFQSYGTNPPIKLPKSLSNKISDITDEMYQVYTDRFEYREEALAAYLRLLLIYTNFVSPDNIHDDLNQGPALVRDFKNLVEEGFREKHKVKEFAELLHVTPNHLNQVIKEYIGRSAKDYIQDCITLEAKRLLIHSDLSNKEIAYQLGFREPVHFSTFFKNQIGQSPKEFKELNNPDFL